MDGKPVSQQDKLSKAAATDRVTRAFRQQLRSLQRAGVRSLPKRQPAQLHQAPTAVLPDSETGTMDQGPQLDVLQQQVAACQLCQELAEQRTQTVFGVGNPNARLCFMGEAPGADEDRQGIPFVGRAGQLLTKIIEACGMQRDDVYILNTLKCRPPGNRNPTTEEAQNCASFFEQQLEIINPEFICCLGAVAAQNLLETTESIGRLRGTFHDLNGRQVLCTYHPAYLLRNPAAKKDVWLDMQILLKAMGLPIPAGGS